MQSAQAYAESKLTAAKVKLVRKDYLWWMRLISKLVFWDPEFMTKTWTTVIYGSIRVIMYPTSRTYDSALSMGYILIHELDHVHQIDKPLFGSVRLGQTWFYIKYFLFPFPVFFAYYRFSYEAQAYEVELRAKLKHKVLVLTPGSKAFKETLDRLVSGIWLDYFFPWPRRLMRKRLERDLTKLCKEVAS